MSQPKRWGLCWTAKVEDPEQGAWVEYADYAALAAENERLRKLLEMYLKADPLIGEAVASAMLVAKEGDRK